MLVSERNKRLFHILGIQALYIKFTQKYKVSWGRKKNHSPVRNVLSSPAKSPTHNTNSQEPAAFNYSHLADTFIQNTFPIPPRWGFFFFLFLFSYCWWPQWEWKPSPPSTVLNVRVSGAAGITWFPCALSLTQTLFFLSISRGVTLERVFSEEPCLSCTHLFFVFSA